MNTSALKDAAIAFLRVWAIGTLMLWLPGLFGWINDVTAWARGQGATPFPDAHGLAYLLVAAITSSFVAAGAGILRFVENLSGKTLLPRAAGPETAPPDGAIHERGQSLLYVALVVLVVVVILAILLR